MTRSKTALRRLLLACASTAAIALTACAADGAALAGPADAKAARAAPASAAQSQAPDLKLAYDQFTLPNGLRVVVHEDRKAPVVAVSVWYGVGSKDEPEGRSGFAHLFEHLMFNGSENYDDEWFRPLEEVGATGLNGTTWFDRTNYFQTVPTPALDRVLWMESDRMGHLLGAVTQAKLDEQRGVVQNEKRQGDNQPYGKVDYAQLEGLYPPGHPYRHSTIGSMEDLEAADLETVHGWFKEYYGAANTVIVLAGDINAATAKPLMEKYFGHIAAGPPLAKPVENVPPRSANTRGVLQDRVPQARIYRTWAVPSRNSREAALLDLAADVLGSGKNSRIYKEFVYDSQVATNAFSYFQPFVLTSQVEAQITLKDPKDIADASATLDKLVADLIAKGPSADELKRAKTKINANTVRGLEQVGGFGGKAVTLAEGALYAGDPGFVNTYLGWINSATTEDVRAAAARWLAKGWHQVEVLPFDEGKTLAAAVDRSKGLPGVGAMPSLTFPDIQETTLANGAKVVLAQRSAVPIVNIAMQFDAGYAADAPGKLGIASFTASMLDEGTKTRDALQIAAEAEGLGAQIGTNSNLDTHTVSLNTLTANLEPAIALWADILRNATFPDSEIERQRKQRLAGISQEKANPVQLALRLLPPAMYGAGHPYGIPLTGSGTEASITAMTKADLVSFRDTWLRPDNATIFVVGDTTMETVKPLLEKALAGWTAPAAAKPVKAAPAASLSGKRRVIIIDRKGSPQSLILAGHVGTAPRAEDNIAVETANDILGGEFSARVNMNLRETKHWAYGAYTFLSGAREQRPWIIYAPVQTDKTGDSMKELAKDVGEYLGKKPATSEELDRIRKQRINELPGSFETAGSVLGSLLTNANYGRPLTYAATVAEEYRSMTLPEIQAGAAKLIKPDSLTWVVVGDRAQIESQVKSLGWGDIEFWDVDGQPAGG